MALTNFNADQSQIELVTPRPLPGVVTPLPVEAGQLPIRNKRQIVYNE